MAVLIIRALLFGVYTGLIRMICPRACVEEISRILGSLWSPLSGWASSFLFGGYIYIYIHNR